MRISEAARTRRAVQADFGLTEIYDAFIASLRGETADSVDVSQSDARVRARNVPVDRYYIPLFAAVALICCELLIAERRRSK